MTWFPFASKQDLWGYVDVHGVTVVEPRFSHAYPFSEGFAFVRGTKPDWDILVMDEKGHINRVKAPWTYEGLQIEGRFSSGLAPMRADRLGKPHAGYINGQGEWVIGPKFVRAHSFSNERAVVKNTWSDGKTGVIDPRGKVIVPLRESDVLDYSDGLAVLVRRDDPWCYIDRDGRIVIEGAFRQGREFCEGHAPVNGRDGWWLIDRTGTEKFAHRYADLRRVGEGLAPAMRKQNGKERWGYIDIKGEEVIPFVYADAKPFSAGLGAVRGDRGWGLIDHRGAMRFPMRYRTIDAFSNGIAYYTMDEKHNTECGYVNLGGEHVVSWLERDHKINDGRPLRVAGALAPRRVETERWRQRALDEHAAVAAFSRLALELLATGAPLNLVTRANLAAIDEAKHAELCIEVVRLLGGDLELPPLPDATSLLTAPKELAQISFTDGFVNEGRAARVLEERSRAGRRPHS